MIVNILNSKIVELNESVDQAYKHEIMKVNETFEYLKSAKDTLPDDFKSSYATCHGLNLEDEHENHEERLAQLQKQRIQSIDNKFEIDKLKPKKAKLVSELSKALDSIISTVSDELVKHPENSNLKFYLEDAKDRKFLLDNIDSEIKIQPAEDHRFLVHNKRALLNNMNNKNETKPSHNTLSGVIH